MAFYGVLIVSVVLVITALSHDCLAKQQQLNSLDGNFTLTRPQSFIEIRPEWPLRERRKLYFRFRTQLPHGLLVHHGILRHNHTLSNYDLYIKLEKGQLRIIHIFNNDITSLFIGKGLNRDVWHSVELHIDPGAGEFSIWLDGELTKMRPKSLQSQPYYGLGDVKLRTVVFFAGLNPNETIWDRQYGYEQFIGCIGNIELYVNESKLTNLNIFSNSHIERGCKDRCDLGDFCLHKSKCVNHYSSTSCDCFGTHYEGQVCGSDALSTVTLRGYSYVSYKIYEWQDKYHSDYTRLSITFRTSFDDSVLFYGLGETPIRNYVAASLKNGSLHFAIDFGDGLYELTMGKHLHNDWWHTFTVLHKTTKVIVELDEGEHKAEIYVTGSFHLHLDPRFYIGGVPFKTPKYGLKSVNNYVGSLKESYFGIKSILEQLKSGVTLATNHGLFPPEYGYREVQTLPVTFFYPESKIRLTAKQDDSLSFDFDFKTNQSRAVLAHSGVVNDTLTGYWELGIEEGAVIITVLSNSSVYLVKLGEDLNNGKWHNVKMTIARDLIELTIDFWQTKKELLEKPVKFVTKIYVGGSTQDPQKGFVGCMRQIKLNSIYMDPRNVVDSDQIEGGDISLDNCQLVDPCAQPGVCEHGGKCIMKDKKVSCNCSGTGYTGKTCHFSLYRRTCEELFLVGYRKQGVYMIDIDGNGPHPPAYVSCDMANELTTTSIMTNLQSEKIVRKLGMKSFRMEVTYRNFTPEMLQTLIRHSKNCTQSLKYQCRNAPLGLRTYSWFRTSYKGSYMSSFGTDQDGYCKCGISGNCSRPENRCMCDAADDRWRSDEAELQDPKQIGITEMFFMQPNDMTTNTDGRIILGPLKCLEMDTQQYVITFKTSESYLEIPGWKTGDLAFSFRTSHKKAILFYQPSLYPTHSHFKIFLVNENELTFEFSLRGEPKSVNVSSQTPLNSGEWQQVWVDYDKHHVRFTINTESKMIDLEKNEEFGQFEGALYVGGAPQEFLEESRIKDGFVGCLRGLVFNEEITNLNSYLSPRTPQIVMGCKPSCDPNPCQNGATCHEYWGTYTCECVSKLAHSGKHCEKNINENGVTFVTENGHFHKLYVDNATMPGVLTEDILITIRTYESKGLVFYAHDQFSNFVQLHIQDGNLLVFTFNSLRHLVNGSIVYKDLTKGHPVQILVDRELNQTTLHVNNVKHVIPHPMNLADKYRQNPWVSGQELEIVKPPRPPVEPKPYLQLFLGALDRGNMESSLTGFIGCVTGFRIGKSDFDLLRLVDENPGTENFRRGCQMSCDKGPCKNGGYCIEDWRNMQHHCDCAHTSFFGKSCQEDVGGLFDGASFAKQDFVPDSSTYQKVKILLAFSTSAAFQSPAVILFINSKVDERNYVLIALQPNGELLIEEDDASRKVIRAIAKSSSGTFMDGMRHWISYSRNMDNIELKVDNEDVVVGHKEDTPIEAPRYGGEKNDVFMVGGMEYIDKRFHNYVNYTGCLSNVAIVIDSFNIYPILTAYGINPGKQNLKIIGSFYNRPCAAISKPRSKDVSSISDHLNLTIPPDWLPGEPEFIPYEELSLRNRDLDIAVAEAATKRVGLILGIFLLILLIALGTYLWRVDWKDKQYRYEEEFGEDYMYTSKKSQRSPDDKAVSGTKYAKSFYYAEPYEILPKYESSRVYMNNIMNGNKMPYLDVEEPPSDADTKLLETSEDDIEPLSDNPENYVRRTPSRELDWEQNGDNNDEVFTEDSNPDDYCADVESMDDVDDIIDEVAPEEPEILEPVITTPNIVPHETFETIPEEEIEVKSADDTDSNNISSDNDPNCIIRQPVSQRPKRTIRPHSDYIHLPNNQRVFSNPISYLGGPKIQHSSSPRNSTESIVSLD